jgi:hypothetical protein
MCGRQESARRRLIDSAAGGRCSSSTGSVAGPRGTLPPGVWPPRRATGRPAQPPAPGSGGPSRERSSHPVPVGDLDHRCAELRGAADQIYQPQAGVVAPRQARRRRVWPVTISPSTSWTGFTELVGTAIANAEGRAQLEESRDELRRLAQEQAALRRVATLVAHWMPPAEVFTAVAHEVRHVLGADATNIVRLDPDGAVTVLTRVGEHQAELPVGSRWKPEPPVAVAVVLRTGRPARCDDFRRLARSLAGALDDAGVTFVKLGQVLSTRADLLATEFVEELSRLQPGASPVPWAEVPGPTEIEPLLVSDVRSAQLR